MKRRFFVTFGKNGFKRQRKMSLRAKWVERAAKTGIIGLTRNLIACKGKAVLYQVMKINSTRTRSKHVLEREELENENQKII